MNDEKELTIDLTDIEQVIRDMQVVIPDCIELYEPVLYADTRDESFLVLEQRGVVKLSDETRAMEEQRLAGLMRKRRALRNRKKYTRKKGTVHPKKKAATRRRRLEKNWRDNPFGCVISGYGAYRLDRELWDKHIAPLWQKFDPTDLTVRKAKRNWKGEYWGTKTNPYTIYSLTVVHRTDGVVFDGAGLELYMLSS